jgi:hypothetical protein
MVMIRGWPVSFGTSGNHVAGIPAVGIRTDGERRAGRRLDCGGLRLCYNLAGTRADRLGRGEIGRRGRRLVDTGRQPPGKRPLASGGSAGVRCRLLHAFRPGLDSGSTECR